MTDVIPIRPMRITAGGVLPVSDIVGRHDQSSRVACLLQSQHCVLLTGDRRVGKTTLSRLVEHNLRADGYRVVRVSAERQSYADFEQALADALTHTATGQVRAELTNWSVTLKAGLLEATRTSATSGMDRLVSLAVGDDDTQPLVLLVDEVPVLARAMEKQQTGSGAELLWTLRRLRQEHGARLWLLMLGSIGFHHVSDDAPGAINDVVKEAVGALTEPYAVYLARCLMVGEDIRTVDDLEVGRAVATAAEGIPYYVQLLVKDLRDDFGTGPSARLVSPDDVLPLVDRALSDLADPWNMRHYRDRVESYYGQELVELVGAVLDIYADESGPLGVDEVLRRLGTQRLERRPTRRELVRLMEHLEQDHYLDRIGKEDQFRTGLVRRAWLANAR